MKTRDRENLLNQIARRDALIKQGRILYRKHDWTDADYNKSHTLDRRIEWLQSNIMGLIEKNSCV